MKLKQGSDPHSRATVWVRGETFKAESKTADLWQPKWNENQTVFASAIRKPDGNAGLLEGPAAEQWSLGTVEQSQGKGCCWLQRDRLRGCEGRVCGGKCLWRKAGQLWKQGDTAESHAEGRAITIASLPHTHQHRQLNNREAGPSKAWCTELQNRTPPRVPLWVPDMPIYKM